MLNDKKKQNHPIFIYKEGSWAFLSFFSIIYNGTLERLVTTNKVTKQL